MSKFNRCTTHKETKDGYSIECKLGLWGVHAPTKAQSEEEAKHYFSQYLLDGEYSSIVGGETVLEKLMKRKCK